MPLILGEMSNPRSRQVVVKKMLELVLITDKAEVRRKRKEKGASTGARRRRKKKQADESSDDERPVRGECGDLVVRTCLKYAALGVRICFNTYAHYSDFSSVSSVVKLYMYICKNLLFVMYRCCLCDFCRSLAPYCSPLLPRPGRACTCMF